MLFGSESRLLQDSFERIEDAKTDYQNFCTEIDRFMLNKLKGMWRGTSPDGKSKKIQLPEPTQLYLRGKSQVIAGKIVEGLRSALDYSIFIISERNRATVNRKHPKFLISDNQKNFTSNAKNALKHLEPVELAFVESLQPYHGNTTLGILRDASNKSKHHRLLSLPDFTGISLVLTNADEDDKYRGWWKVAEDHDSSFYAKPNELRKVLLLERYYAIETFKCMIDQVGTILNAFVGTSIKAFWRLMRCWLRRKGFAPSEFHPT